MARYKLLQDGVYDTERKWTVPNDPDNKHWQEYLVWVAIGNTPDPADPPSKFEPSKSDILTRALIDKMSLTKADLDKAEADLKGELNP